MAAITSALCVTFLAHMWIFTLVSSSEEIKVKSGGNVTLQCQSPRGEAFTALEWFRPELKTDGYVFFFRDDRPYENYQLPSFHGRVQLRDPEMKNGDVSVILKNVNINDAGTYECRVSVNSKGRRKRAPPELMNSINLKVEDSAHTSGNTWTEGDEEAGNPGLTVGLSVAALLLVVVVIAGFVIHKRKHLDQPVHYTEASAQQA